MGVGVGVGLGLGWTLSARAGVGVGVGVGKRLFTEIEDISQTFPGVKWPIPDISTC